MPISDDDLKSKTVQQASADIAADLAAALPAYSDDDRPTASAQSPGFVVWNSTTGIPNYSDGTQWVDAAGNPTGGPPPPDPTLTITMPTSVDQVESGDLGAVFQGTGAHTLYGGAVYFDHDQYLWTSLNGLGVDPGVTGTAHEVALTGTAPFTPTQWATEADSVITAAGYTVASPSAGVLTVTGNSIDPTGAATAQAALTAFTARGGGGVIGSTQQDAGASTNGASTGWVQVLPADVPSGTFRVIGFGIRRGSNVASGVRMSLAADGTSSDGNPEGALVVAGRTVGDSGAGNWHYEYLPTAEMVEFSGGNRLFIATHGDGASSSLFGGGGVDDGLYAGGGGINLWLTDGTTGSTTPAVSPVGAVTSQFNFGLAIRLIIQEAPYQTDSAYRVIGNAVPGRHDQNLFGPGTPVNQIFVAWRIQSPAIDAISLMDTHIRLQAHAAGDSNQIRLELWNPLGGAATFEGDTIVSTIGVTSDTQGTGWSSLQSTPISVSSDTEYRFSLKGDPDPGSVNDTILDIWLGSAGADSQTLAGYPVYGPSGVDIPGTEREVQGTVDETQIDFDPQVQTASPIVSDGTVISPNNLSMVALYWGKPAPTVVAS